MKTKQGKQGKRNEKKGDEAKNLKFNVLRVVFFMEVLWDMFYIGRLGKMT